LAPSFQRLAGDAVPCRECAVIACINMNFWACPVKKPYTSPANIVESSGKRRVNGVKLLIKNTTI
jgi:hypothetical protein